MTGNYFGDPSNLDSPAIWAEVQVAGWMLDGGFILVGLYVGALIATALYDWKLATRARDPRVRIAAAVILSANAGTFALIFSFTPFMTQIGIQYWFLAGAIHAAARHTDLVYE
jgi:hypothetical protein